MYPNVRQLDNYETARLWENGGPYDYEEERASLRRIVLALVLLLGTITVLGLIQII
jgi:hypothetical protein